MAAFALPALISFFCKVALLVYAMRAPRRDATTRLFVTLLGLLALHNLIEILGFGYFAVRGGVNYATIEGFGYGYAYFAIAIVAIALTLHVSLRLSVDGWDAVRAIVPLIYLPVPFLEYLLLGTDKLVAGFEPFQQFTVLRVPGPLYALFEVYALIYSLAALGYLVYGARPSRPSIMNRIRNRWWLLGITPLILLNIYLIVANHLGAAKISSTVSIPIAFAFFLVVATYATHQYRLFDIEFFLPWSKVRQRKSAFYARIQATVAELAQLGSVRDALNVLANALRCHVAVVGGFRPLVALPQGHADVQAGGIAQFPCDALQDVHRITVTNEIAETQPDLHALLKRHHIGAVVPFAPKGGTPGNWLLVGDHFSDNVYTPLDFKVVETLFSRLGDMFVHGMLLVRTQLADAREEMERYQARLAVAWNQLDELQRKCAQLQADLRKERAENTQLRRRAFRVIGQADAPPRLPPEVSSGEMSMDAYLERCETEMICEALKATRGNTRKAARLLGISDVQFFHYILERRKIERADFR